MAVVREWGSRFVVYQVGGGAIKDFYGRTLFKLDGNKIRKFSGEVIYMLDGNYIKDFYGRYLYEFVGNQIKPWGGLFKYRIDGEYFKDYYGKYLYIFEGSMDKYELMAISLILILKEEGEL